MIRSGTSGEIAARAAAGFGWNMAGGLVRALSGLGVNMLLARLLGPEAFGQVALATVAVGLGSLVVDAGLSVSLIQKADLDELDVRSVFTIQMALGLVLAPVLALLAPWVAWMLGQEHVAPILRVLSGLLVIQAFGQTGTALLRRDGEFQRMQQLQIGSYLAAYLGVGIPLALRGAGVWSLVAAQVTQATLYSGGAWLATRHSLRLFAGRRGMAEFGRTLVVSNLVAWAVGALPALLIGRFQGVVMLGYFSRSFFLVSMPASVLATSLQTTSLTVYSRLQRHKRLAGRVSLGLTMLCLLATVPPYFLVAAMPGTVVEALFGEAWLPMAGLLAPLALAMPLECVAALSGPLLIARGRPGLELRLQTVTAASTLLVVGGLSIWTTTVAVAWGVLVAVYLVRASLAVRAMLREVALPVSRWVRTAGVPMALGFAGFVAARILDPYLMGQGLAPWPRMALMGGLAAAAAGVLVLSGGGVKSGYGRAWAVKRIAAYV